MTNYARLCEKIDIKLDFKYSIKGENNFHEKITILNCDKNSVIALFSGEKTNLKVVKVSKQMNFTAEKQIELIKMFLNKLTFTGYSVEANGKEIFILESKIFKGCNADFTEALAGLVLQLIEAGELDKYEVRRILE